MVLKKDGCVFDFTYVAPPGEVEPRLPDFDTPIGINVNGCPNSCARFQTADIGFKGSMVREIFARVA